MMLIFLNMNIFIQVTAFENKNINKFFEMILNSTMDVIEGLKNQSQLKNV